MRTAILSQVETRHGTQLNAQGLQKNGENVGQKHNEQQGILELCTGCNVGGIVSRVDICHRDEEAGPTKRANLTNLRAQLAADDEKKDWNWNWKGR
jgi:hypothetical protein